MERTIRLLTTYRVGEYVPLGGCYVCVPCGFRMYLSEGEVFPSCISCMRVSRPDAPGQAHAGSGEIADEFDEELVAEDLELWEFVVPDEGQSVSSASSAQCNPHHSAK